MAKINNSSYVDANSFRYKSYELIAGFDELDHVDDQTEYIRQLEISKVNFFQSLAETLRERLDNPPNPIPDKSLFLLDTSRMDKVGLINLIDDIRFLLALKYRTF